MDITITRSDKQVKAYLDDQLVKNNINQIDVQKALGRSSGYVSERMSGKQSWAVSELDRIAPLLNLPNALSILAAASSYDVR